MGDVVREAFAQFPTGVTVVTVSDADGPHGCTVSAFTPVSLEPPLVVVCFMNGGSMIERVARRGVFAVNVLAATQWNLGRHFADRGRPRGEAGFAAVQWHPSPLGSPLFGGAVAQFDCTLDSARDVGDHTLCVGHVESVDVAPAEPLTYCRGRFARAATCDVR
jgi:3-hydroxy-9,10-secoandrosta-1,3,5(10)-triene-9,17-dione monooxygenase reductase component